ncbi:MAG: DDE-type integrase/transposase/recombinase [Planctomycetes bacterium]|nr:DDE-type integrase/transposase/recombinase [Planctomycetota bacterium]
MDDKMPGKKKQPQIPLPKSWDKYVKSGILHVFALAQYALIYSRSWAADSSNQRAGLKVERDRWEQEAALVHEAMRIKDVRMALLAPQRRPHYAATERMAILELRAARCWSYEQAAREFLVTAKTISSWVGRIDEAGTTALVQTPQPINKFPDCVRYAVQRLKVLCPSLGKLKIAQVLCRAGLHLGTSTVGRILKEPPHPKPSEKQAPTQAAEEAPPAEKVAAELAPRVVTAKRANHVWHVDLTLVPTQMGFWTSWLPFSLPQCWPFGYWVAVVVDHFSRRAMGFAVFKKDPNSRDVRSFLGRLMRQAKVKPKYLICDKTMQFWCEGFKDWCEWKGIEPPRYGAVGQHGSIAVVELVERFILTMKNEGTRRYLVSLRRETFRDELVLFIDWYNEYRPHTTLGGKTPEEVYHHRYARQSQTKDRTSPALATWCALCQTSDTHCREIWPTV